MSMRNRSGGFTLIELMITVAIIGILAAIAYPVYIDQVRQSRRTDAISLLMRAANAQERYYTTQYEYATSMKGLGFACDLASPCQTETDNKSYMVKVDSADSEGFQLTATAQGDQINDECTKYGLNELGEKTANDTSASSDISQDCW